MHNPQRKGFWCVPAYVKTENAHGNWQVLPETAVCV